MLNRPVGLAYAWRLMSGGKHPYTVLITPEWYPWPEQPGLGVWAREQALAVARRNRVAVLACAPDDTLRPRYSISDAVEDGLRVLRVRYRQDRSTKVGFANRLAGMLAALRVLRAEGFQPDVVHAHVFSSGLPALAVGRRCGAPVVVSEHFSGLPLGLLGRWDRTIARFVFHRAAVVCPASANLGTHIRALAPRAHLRPAPNPVDTSVFRPPSPAEDGARGSVRALNVGALKDRKGHEGLLRALALARDRGLDLQLEVVGDGPLRGELETLARELRLGRDAVSFTGSLQKEDVAVRMRAADFLVLPSLWENAPVVAIEALASGLPVLACRVGGIPEIVGAEAGALVAPGDVDDMAQGLARMAAGLSAFDRAGLAEAARARYGFDAVCALWEEIYGDAVGSRSPPGRAAAGRAP